MAPLFRNVAGDGVVREGDELAGLHVGGLLLPTLTLRQSALEHNVELFARWCRERGLSHAPHGKTTMAPDLFRRQLDAGAWAITAATVAQTRLMWRYGVRRVLLANQVVDTPGLRWIAATLSSDPHFSLLVLVDSVAGVQRAESALGEAGSTRPMEVLIELGVEGGRTGVRSRDEAYAVAAAVAQSQYLRLAGVECFEGVYAQDRSDASLERVDGFVGSLGELLASLEERGAFADRDEVVITAGGSGYPDRVADAFDALPELSLPTRRVIRSGGYITHDHGILGRCSPLAPGAGHPLGALQPALELWAWVLSTPEAGLALCGFGKRDAPHDIELPVPLGRIDSAGQRSGLDGAQVIAVNDQHAFVRHEADVAVADMLVFGISHPCTAFDKWPLIPVLDDAECVVGGVRTYF